MLGPRYRDFIDAIKRYVGASIDQKPISLSTTYLSAAAAWQCAPSAWRSCLPRIWRWHGSARPSDLGNYFILIGVTNIVASAGSLGLGPAAVRFVPAFAAQQRSDLQAGYIYATLKVTVAGTLLVSGAAVLVAAIFQHELTHDLHVGLFLFAILLPLTTLQFVSLDLLRALRLPLQGQTVTSFMPPVLVFGGVIIASQFGQLSFQVIGSIACISAALTVIVQLDALRRLVFRRLVGVTPQSRTVRMGAGVVANNGIDPGIPQCSVDRLACRGFADQRSAIGDLPCRPLSAYNPRGSGYDLLRVSSGHTSRATTTSRIKRTIRRLSAK